MYVCMYVCMYIYIYMCIYIYIYTLVINLSCGHLVRYGGEGDIDVEAVRPLLIYTNHIIGISITITYVCVCVYIYIYRERDLHTITYNNITYIYIYILYTYNVYYDNYIMILLVMFIMSIRQRGRSSSKTTGFHRAWSLATLEDL